MSEKIISGYCPFKDVAAKDRMKVGAAEWREMSVEERAEWERRFKQHQLDLKQGG
jgi:hypothetical protein